MERFTLLTIAILLFASITKAQITKGSVYLGGSINVASTKQEVNGSSNEGKLKAISINPSVGLAIKRNLVAGINLTYLNGRSKNYQNYQDFDRDGYGGGFFVRKYFPIVNRLYFFGESGLSYDHQKQESFYQSQTQNKVTQDNIFASLYTGLSFQVFKSFYIETSFPDIIQLGYQKTTTMDNSYIQSAKRTDKGVVFQSNLTSGSYLNVGVRFIIPKK
jgi:hypothetical protein